MKSKIFISYARSDYPHAHKLVESLKHDEVRGWMDSADISAGSATASGVRSALRGSKAMVVLVSPASLGDRWVNFELGAGVAQDLPIIPIIVGGDDLERDMPEWLSENKLVDARNMPMDAVAEEVEKALC
jgi:hypothetical protein